MLKDPLELDLERLLKSLGGSMRKYEWFAPLIVLLCTMALLTTSAAIYRSISIGTIYDKETQR